MHVTCNIVFAGWKCVYYTFSFLYGLIVLWDKPWFWDINHCFYNYPYHPVTDDIWWYYMVSTTFYGSLCFSLFFDVIRKYFWKIFIHDIITITLMCLSWVVNLTRIGSLILLIHSCADIFLHATKMAKYANYKKLCNFLTAIYIILWIVTRMGIYPFWIIYNTFIEVPKAYRATYKEPIVLAYHIFNSLLILLQFLHATWTYLFLKVIYNAFNAGQIKSDIRSHSSDEVSDTSNQ